jgi:L-alanine-DL-glutamate epimerase-like enolase superfamily enzyme
MKYRLTLCCCLLAFSIVAARDSSGQTHTMGRHNIALSTLRAFTLPGDVSASQRYWDTDVVEPEILVSARGTIAAPSGPGLGYNIRHDLIAGRL